MAHQDGEAKGATGIARVGKRKWGYDPAQVDAFLDKAHTLYESEDGQLTQQDIQNTSFDIAKGGYDIAQVDAALSRLEQAVVDQQTTREITDHGRVAWKAQTEELYQQVCAHANRSLGERFARGRDSRPSYDRKQVDRLVDQIIDKASISLGGEEIDDQTVKKLADLNSSTVSNVIFTQRKGKRGYDERQVDFYLNVCVQLLSRLESFARIADYVGTPAEPAVSAPPRSFAPQGVTPLFGDGDAYAQPQAESPVMPEATAEGNPSFSELHEAEAALFTAPAPSVQSVPSARPTVVGVSATVSPAGSPVSVPAVLNGVSTEQATPAVTVPFANAAPAPQVPVAQPTPSSIDVEGGASSSLADLAQRVGNTTATASVSEHADVAPQGRVAQSIPLMVHDTPQSQQTVDAAYGYEPHVAGTNSAQTTSQEMPYGQEQTVAAQSQPLFVQPIQDSQFAQSDKLAQSEQVTQSASNESQTHDTPNSDAQSSSNSDDLFSNLYFDPGASMSFDIPDLSFPTLNTTSEEDVTKQD